MRRLVRAWLGQERAVANARTACTALSRQRLEREDVELFLERHERRARRRTA
jgi:hypothetical protein